MDYCVQGLQLMMSMVQCNYSLLCTKRVAYFINGSVLLYTWRIAYCIHGSLIMVYMGLCTCLVAYCVHIGLLGLYIGVHGLIGF